MEEQPTLSPTAPVVQGKDDDRENSIDNTATAQKPNDKAAIGRDDDVEYEYIVGFKLAVVMIAVTLVAFLMMLDLAIISTAIPRITSDLHSLPVVGWYGSAYLLASCSLQPLTGQLYTYFSSKYTFLTFLALFEIGSLLCGVAKNSDMLIVGRAIAGMGASGLMNGALTIISACVPLAKRPAYLGFIISISQIGTVLGPLIGGVLTQYSTWRWCFYINLPIGAVVAIPLVLISIPDRTMKSDTKPTILNTAARLDLFGFALFAPAAVQLLLALQWGGERYPWNDAEIIGLFCGAFGTYCLILGWEFRQGDAAMIPVSTVRRRVVYSAFLTNFFFFGSMLITNYYLPIYFQAVRHATPTTSGVYLLPAILSQIIFATVSGVLVSRLGYYLPWSVACAVLAPIGTGLLATLTPTTSSAKWIGYQIIAGSGRGMSTQMTIIAVQNVLPMSQVSIALAIVIFSQLFGGALFLSFAQTDFTNGLTTLIPVRAPGVNPQSVLEAGASAVRQAVPEAALEGVLDAYNTTLSRVFYLAAACAAAMFVFCWGLGWRSIKKAKKVEPKV